MEAEKQACTFTPKVNQSGRRFTKNQRLFESLHELARSKQNYEADQKYYETTYKLQKQAYLASREIKEPQRVLDSIHNRLFSNHIE